MEERQLYVNGEAEEVMEIEVRKSIPVVGEDGKPVLNEKGKPVKERVKLCAQVGVNFGKNIQDAAKRFGKNAVWKAWEEFCERSMETQITNALMREDVDMIKEIENNFVPWVDERVTDFINGIEHLRNDNPTMFKELVEKYKEALEKK